MPCFPWSASDHCIEILPFSGSNWMWRSRYMAKRSFEIQLKQLNDKKVVWCHLMPSCICSKHGRSFMNTDAVVDNACRIEIFQALTYWLLLEAAHTLLSALYIMINHDNDTTRINFIELWICRFYVFNVLTDQCGNAFGSDYTSQFHSVVSALGLGSMGIKGPQSIGTFCSSDSASQCERAPLVW